MTVSSATQFSPSAGRWRSGYLTATVPNNAPYAAKEILDITNLSVFDNSQVPQPLPSVGQDAIHVAAYFGDTNGDGGYTTQDVTLEQRFIALHQHRLRLLQDDRPRPARRHHPERPDPGQ